MTQEEFSTIRTLGPADRAIAVAVINEAATWYSEFLPSEELGEVEMTEDEWELEAQRMTWYGAFQDTDLIGVMGLEYVADVALFRHAYVRPSYQRSGVAAKLQLYIEGQVRNVKRIVVGTYTGNYKARSALEKSGYRLAADSDAVLRAYYEIPDDRVNASVAYERTVEG